MNKLAILDRDGVINEDSDEYIKSPDEWIPIPGSLEAIARLNAAGCRIIVVSNQSGIARGLFSMDDLNKIHRKMHQALADVGGNIDAIFFCPHSPKDNCDCRKPKPGLLNEISQCLMMPLDNVPVIGDSLRDIIAAREVGADPYLVRTGKGQQTIEDDAPQLEDVPVYDDLEEVVEYLLSNDLV
jgi:D-glycero-D-manno-heptose 1,7-bisphosphate phosphatase